MTLCASVQKLGRALFLTFTGVALTTAVAFAGVSQVRSFGLAPNRMVLRQPDRNVPFAAFRNSSTGIEVGKISSHVEATDSAVFARGIARLQSWRETESRDLSNAIHSNVISPDRIVWVIRQPFFGARSSKSVISGEQVTVVDAATGLVVCHSTVEFKRAL